MPTLVLHFCSASKVSDDGSMLIIAVMNTSELYLVDAETGAATLIDLGDDAVSGDGLVRAHEQTVKPKCSIYIRVDVDLHASVAGCLAIVTLPAVKKLLICESGG